MCSMFNYPFKLSKRENKLEYQCMGLYFSVIRFYTISDSHCSIINAADSYLFLSLLLKIVH